MRPDRFRAIVFLAGLAIWCAGGSLSSDDVAAQGQETRAGASASAPTFSRDIAPIFYNRCVSCHRPGEVAPMSLISYRDVRPWASAIREKVTTRVMPPWHADRQYGTFRNDLSLTQREIDTIASWVSAGASEGNPSDLPALPKFPAGWQIGTPDQVFEMQAEYQVPASGEIEYQYFEVPTNFTEDKWMQAGEVRAGDKAHVHHIIVYVREPKASGRPTVMSVRPILAEGQTPPPAPARAPGTASPARASAPGGGDAMLVNWAVGEDAPVYVPGTAKRIPAGSTLIFQVHYTTNGTTGVDRSRIGLIFAKEPPRQEIRTGIIANPMFAIPAGAPNHEVAAEATFSEDVKIWTMHPHMHLRGKDMTYTAIYPDGRSQIVLNVPKFDFGWQTDYWLAEPLTMPKGSKLHVRAHFDNSAANRSNPDPAKVVRWGDQTWEEMMIGFFTYTVEGQPARSSLQ
jgi:hypothetical protein